jgi:hypothetical protein
MFPIVVLAVVTASSHPSSDDSEDVGNYLLINNDVLLHP